MPTKGVQRRRRLTTYSTKRKERKRVKQIEREKKSSSEENFSGLEQEKIKPQILVNS